MAKQDELMDEEFLEEELTLEEEEERKRNLIISRRNYIKDKFILEDTIAKEIFKLYDDIPEQEIKQAIANTCYIPAIERFPTIEKPINEGERESLTVVKQHCINKEIIMDRKGKKIILDENGEPAKKHIIYKNYPEVYKFMIQGSALINGKQIFYWKPPEIKIIDEALKNVPQLNFKGLGKYCVNYYVLKAFLDSQIVNLIVIRNSFYRPIYMKTRIGLLEERCAEKDLNENEFGILVDKINEELDKTGLDYKNDTRIMLVVNSTFSQFYIPDHNEYMFNSYIKNDREYVREMANKPRHLALMNIGRAYKDGIFLEYIDEEKRILDLCTSVYYLNEPEDVFNIDFGKKKDRHYKVQNFNDPVIKWMLFTKPKKKSKKLTFDGVTVRHLSKYLNEHDKETLEEVFPDAVFLNLNNKNVIPNQRKRETIEKLLDYLDDKRENN